MQGADLYLTFVRPLNDLEIPYMISGSVAAMVYGEPRLTHDIDLIMDLLPPQISSFHEVFAGSNFYVPPVEVIQVEAARERRGHFNLIDRDTGFKADVYLKGNDELHVWAFRNKKPEKIDGTHVWLAPVEYLIIRKMMYYKEGRSEKHVTDIKNMISRSKQIMDVQIISKKAKKYRLSDVWESIIEN